MTTKTCLDEEDIAKILAEYYDVSRDKVQMIWRETTRGYGMAEHSVMEFHAEIEIPVPLY